MSAPEPGLPPPPAPPPVRMSASHKALAGFLGALILAKLIEMAAHLPMANASPLAVFSWKMLAFFVALALLGSGFAHVDGFPGMWEEGLSVGRKIGLPLAIGAGLGAILLAVDRLTGFAHLYVAAAGLPSLALPFPYSLLFQFYVGACAAILYNLFALAFTVWFVGTLLLARRWPALTFWVFAVLTALWEPLTMVSQHDWALLHSVPLPAGALGMLVLVYAMDLVAAILIRRYGFTAALVMRISAVIVWHIIGTH